MNQLKPHSFKIISGGQTGVDRAALDIALKYGWPIGGFCPKGRLAEDGVIPKKYPLQETETADYRERTELNVRRSDGTLIITRNKPFGGTQYTIEMAKKWGKALFIFDLEAPSSTEDFSEWLSEKKITSLNVAGPRESQFPGIHKEAVSILERLLNF